MTEPVGSHIETEQVPGRRLGKRPPKNAPALRLADVLTGVVPPHPVAADNLSKITDWNILGNDRVGDCGPVSVANSRAVTTKYLTGAELYPNLTDVFDLYRRSGNPNFDPATGADDNGVDMQTMLEAVQKGGIAGTKSVAFAKVDHTNLDEIRAAIAIFGFVLFGVTLEVAQQSQRGLWDYSPSAVWGGHAVIGGAYSSAASGQDIVIETWAALVGLTDRFVAQQVDEVWVVIWPEHLGTAQFQTGVDKTALAQAYQSLTGKVLPLPVDPGPAPSPDPNPAPAPAPTPAPPGGGGNPFRLSDQVAARVDKAAARAHMTDGSAWLEKHLRSLWHMPRSGG